MKLSTKELVDLMFNRYATYNLEAIGYERTQFTEGKFDMRMTVVSMFLIVAQEDGLTVSELARRCGVRKMVLRVI